MDKLEQAARKIDESLMESARKIDESFQKAEPAEEPQVDEDYEAAVADLQPTFQEVESEEVVEEEGEEEVAEVDDED